MKFPDGSNLNSRLDVSLLSVITDISTGESTNRKLFRRDKSTVNEARMNTPGLVSRERVRAA
jgi:hypothetical protein